MSDEEIELRGDNPKGMTMKDFWDEQAQFTECRLCDTLVHIDTEYLDEEGCVYCVEE
ncbi:MAG: hypothetical protein ACYTE3_12855 [Planctomycetota bacterium]|jgi:hypothetical protein